MTVHSDINTKQFTPKRPPDRFSQGERIVCAKDILSSPAHDPMFLRGEHGTVIFREPLSNDELYHVEPDAPHSTLFTSILATPDYLEAEA